MNDELCRILLLEQPVALFAVACGTGAVQRHVQEGQNAKCVDLRSDVRFRPAT
jgi:hypothetical protein